jgi:hypothetical protein
MTQDPDWLARLRHAAGPDARPVVNGTVVVKQVDLQEAVRMLDAVVEGSPAIKDLTRRMLDR